LPQALQAQPPVHSRPWTNLTKLPGKSLWCYQPGAAQGKHLCTQHSPSHTLSGAWTTASKPAPTHKQSQVGHSRQQLSDAMLSTSLTAPTPGKMEGLCPWNELGQLHANQANASPHKEDTPFTVSMASTCGSWNCSSSAVAILCHTVCDWHSSVAILCHTMCDWHSKCDRDVTHCMTMCDSQCMLCAR
jgi:hypothetical protein